MMHQFKMAQTSLAITPDSEISQDPEAVHIDGRPETASSFADNCPLDTSDDPSKDNHSPEHGWFTIAKALEIVVLICFLINLSGYDIAMFIESGRNQPDDVKLKLIDLCVPEQSFKFPGRKYNDSKHKSGVYTRYYNRDWLNEFQLIQNR